MDTSIVQATLIFERDVPAAADRVYKAYTDIAERLKWGAPSENTALLYDKTDFREGGKMFFAAALNRIRTSKERRGIWISWRTAALSQVKRLRSTDAACAPLSIHSNSILKVTIQS